MAVLDFVMLFLAAGALVNAWMMTDGLFEGVRDWLDSWGEPSGGLDWKDRVYDNIRWFISKLFTCRTCLTYHVSFWLIVIFWLPSLFWLKPPWSLVWFIPVYALAATRLSLLIGTAVAWMEIDGDPETD
jgi:hypothetical protein